MPNVPNWQIARTAVSSMRNGRRFSTSPVRMATSAASMSIPESSSGGLLSAGMLTLCLRRSHSTRQWFEVATFVESMRISNALFPVPPTSWTGSRNRGARASAPVDVVWTSDPNVRYRFDAPVSSSSVLASRWSRLKRRAYASSPTATNAVFSCCSVSSSDVGSMSWAVRAP